MIHKIENTLNQLDSLLLYGQTTISNMLFVEILLILFFIALIFLLILRDYYFSKKLLTENYNKTQNELTKVKKKLCDTSAQKAVVEQNVETLKTELEILKQKKDNIKLTLQNEKINVESQLKEEQEKNSSLLNQMQVLRAEIDKINSINKLRKKNPLEKIAIW